MTGLWSAFSMLSFGSSITFMDPSPYKDIVSGMVHSKCAVIGATSTIIEQLVDDVKETKDASLLSSLKYIMYSGTPLCDGSERWIHSHDIHLHHMYGSAESGAVMGAEGHSLAPLFFDENGASYLNFEMTDEPNMRHLSIRSDCPSLANNVSNRLDGGYDTNDLFMVDHKNPGYYLYAGRKDDTFVMSNGEKTNPIPIENAIRASPIVHQVLVVGRNRQYTGCLVSVNTGLAHTMSPIELMDAVHIAVKEANIDCPKHSAILPQMVKILPLDKTIPITEKGTVIRKKAETEFKDMIDKLYEKLAHSLNAMDPQDGNIDPTTWSEKQVKTFLVENVSNILDKPISTFDDYNRSLFEFGLNSILAIQLRNQIAEHFDNVAQNFVFQHPTINDMYATLTSDDAQDALELIKARYLQTQEIALDYIKRAEKDFCVSKNNYDASKPKVILLTGATGSLGSFMLRDLLLDSTVKKVYCPVRGKQGQLFQRLIEAFESRFLDISLLKNTERVQAVPMRFNEPYLGFGKARYDQLREEVTIIQHCAWLVDFHMPVDHFDKECIAPFYNLLKFSSKEENPMHVHFISSVSAAALAGPEIEEAPLIFDSFVAMPIGYGQSKFIVERLLEYLNSEKNLPCYVERVGQVCGDSQNGVWNTTEQYPLMFIGGGAIMHKMPDFDLDIDWITVDYAAAAIVHIMHSTAHHPANKDGSVFHIVNPRRIHWSDILSAMRSAGMMFETVAPIEWLEALSKDASNPAFRLVPFYEDTSMATKMPIFKTEKTIAMAPIMEVSPVLDDGLFSKFLKHWKAIGFYQPLVTMQSKM
jgi:thioester reductase-like protein